MVGLSPAKSPDMLRQMVDELGISLSEEVPGTAVCLDALLEPVSGLHPRLPFLHTLSTTISDGQMQRPMQAGGGKARRALCRPLIRRPHGVRDAKARIGWLRMGDWKEFPLCRR